MTDDIKKWETVTDVELLSFKMPEPSDWELVIGGEYGIIYTPTKGKEPNRFHRFMQGLVLGFKWRKKKKK